MVLLDTNVLSELMRPDPHPAVLAWSDQLDPEAVGITAMNEAEILHGLARLPRGRRRQSLEERWEQLVPAFFSGRVFSFDRMAAHWYAQLLHQRGVIGRPMATADAVIAATALALGATLATRNTADFAGVGLPLINPWPTP
ncbi:type II toxin-antitoxin system VapC family toxin [Synechococcus sp. CS-1326]|uniref:type II toxin-antitoxin system VapC family toxin n=1 Tax=Synechococcus sp. CS-1326 TaxID=2847978 RepID=UPI00223C0C5D|nr:type II toxin-antitoxin system VapC family toxin [Synechococcus sp. CS-1326]MCT0214367.1 type II toxin-antitoxin system VapC family toxin [Synechococcus sp. CS-1326]